MSLTSMTHKQGRLYLLLAVCFTFVFADLVHAVYIQRITGIRDGQTVSGEVMVETVVADANDGRAYEVRYQVDGPTSFIMTARRAPYVLAGRRTGWDTSNAETGNYRLTAYLITDGRVIDFRSVSFSIGKALKVSRIVGINRDIVLSSPTTVEAVIRGGTPSKVVFEIKGPKSVTHVERDRPYFLLGDNHEWDINQMPVGDYTIDVTAYDGNTPVHTRSLPFRIERDIRIRRIIGINNDMVVTGPVRVEADVIGGKPSKVVFKVTGPKKVYDVETEPPYVMFGDGNTWDTTSFPEGRYTLRVITFSGEERSHSRTLTFEIKRPRSKPEPEPTPTPRPQPDPTPTPRSRNFLGMNLAELTYYTREWVFVDAMKQARPWLPTRTGSSDPWDSGENLRLDANGWPILRPGQAAHTIMYHDTLGSYPAGRYVCTWEGDGEVVLGWDAREVNRRNRRIVAQVNPTNRGIYLRIDRSNPDNPVRNIRVWLPGFEDAQSPFHPFYLKRLKPFSVIRFMDWQRTNGSGIVSWSDRPKPTYFTQGTDDGVALEYMIDLCNELGADPWFCMPHLANDRYVENFAKLVKSRLRKDLNVYVEWSNEIWNSQFPQHRWVRGRADGRSLSMAFHQVWAEEADRDFEIWEEVWGNQSDRVIRVAAGQKDNPWVTEQLVDALGGEFDAISCSTYFGFTHDEERRLNAGTRPSEILDRAMAEMTRRQRTNYQAHGQLSRKWSRKLGRNIPLIGYEGGQHYTVAGGNPPYAKAYLTVQNHPKMYQVYLANMREWENAGGSLFTAFNFVEKPDQWGAWGHLDLMDQAISDSPKMRALLDYRAKR
ncbi:MAG: hypothetical protein Kow00105_12460 [Phycisphaeraceae bacterium]